MNDKSYRRKLAMVREADRRNDEIMTVIANRAGMSLSQLRNLHRPSKDRIIDYYRDGGGWENKNG